MTQTGCFEKKKKKNAELEKQILFLAWGGHNVICSDFWNKEIKWQRAGKIKSLCITAIVYLKCKGYTFEVNIVLSVKPKPKLYEWKESKDFDSLMNFLNSCGKIGGLSSSL